MDEISTLIKETPETYVTPSSTEGHSKEMATYKPESRSSPGTESSGIFIGGFLAYKNYRNYKEYRNIGTIMAYRNL